MCRFELFGLSGRTMSALLRLGSARTPTDSSFSNCGGCRTAAVLLSQDRRPFVAGTHASSRPQVRREVRTVCRLALSNSSTPWRDEPSQNRPGQQELQSYGEDSPRAMPAAASVEELPSTRAQEGENMLEGRERPCRQTISSGSSSAIR
jgi:hypothetical protein